MNSIFLPFLILAICLRAIEGWKRLIRGMESLDGKRYTTWEEKYILLTDMIITVVTVFVFFLSLYYSAIFMIVFDGWLDLLFGTFLVLSILVNAWLIILISDLSIGGVNFRLMDAISQVGYWIPVGIFLILLFIKI